MPLGERFAGLRLDYRLIDPSGSWYVAFEVRAKTSWANAPRPNNTATIVSKAYFLITVASIKIIYLSKGERFLGHSRHLAQTAREI